jgi:hypothetical protein
LKTDPSTIIYWITKMLTWFGGKRLIVVNSNYFGVNVSKKEEGVFT